MGHATERDVECALVDIVDKVRNDNADALARAGVKKHVSNKDEVQFALARQSLAESVQAMMVDILRHRRQTNQRTPQQEEVYEAIENIADTSDDDCISVSSGEDQLTYDVVEIGSDCETRNGCEIVFKHSGRSAPGAVD